MKGYAILFYFSDTISKWYKFKISLHDTKFKCESKVTTLTAQVSVSDVQFHAK